MLASSQKIESAAFYLTIALRRAKTDLSHITLKTPYKLLKQKQLEKNRLRLLREPLHQALKTITQTFPSLDGLNEFYTQLINATVDADRLKKSLATLQWGHDKINQLTHEYQQRIDKSASIEGIKQQTKTCLGRISSVLQRIPFTYLDQSRQILRNYPTIKEMYTVALAGFPNVGKSTLLSKLTTAKPEIKAYAFTTKTLNVGYYKKHPYTLQVIDTPGSLARFEKMNTIEQQAQLALKYASQLIVYIYDLTETSYPLIDQERLHQQLLELDKPMITYLSKTDLLSEKQVQSFLQKHPDALISLKKLQEKLLENAQKH